MYVYLYHCYVSVSMLYVCDAHVGRHGWLWSLEVAAHTQGLPLFGEGEGISAPQHLRAELASSGFSL
jgi:hypothetical protein